MMDEGDSREKRIAADDQIFFSARPTRGVGEFRADDDRARRRPKASRSVADEGGDRAWNASSPRVRSGARRLHVWGVCPIYFLPETCNTHFITRGATGFFEARSIFLKATNAQASPTRTDEARDRRVGADHARVLPAARRGAVCSSRVRSPDRRARKAFCRARRDGVCSRVRAERRCERGRAAHFNSPVDAAVAMRAAVRREVKT